MKAFLLVRLLSSLVSPAHAKSRYHAIEGRPVTVGGTGYHEVVLVHAAYLGDEHNDEVFRATIQADLEFFSQRMGLRRRQRQSKSHGAVRYGPAPVLVGRARQADGCAIEQ